MPDTKVARLAASRVSRRGPDAAPPVAQAMAQRRRVLVLGQPEALRPLLQPNRETDLLLFVDLAHLDASLLHRFCPDVVLAPLISGNWDILDLAARLTGAGWRGPLLVQAPALPRAELVIGEIKALFPELSLALVEQAP